MRRLLPARAMPLTAALFAIALIVVLAPQTARAAGFYYIKYDMESDCTITEEIEEGGSVRLYCPETVIPLHIAEGDLRMFVSFWPTGQTEKAMKQTFGPFNYVHPVIEIRHDGPANAPEPYAAIQRWILSPGDGAAESQVLVVTALEPGNVCRVARIDALANPSANQLARDAADRMARNFDCRRDRAVWYGKAGSVLGTEVD